MSARMSLQKRIDDYRDGYVMTRPNVALRLKLAVQAASAMYPDLATRRVSPHTIRHATAMSLLQAGVDISVIALWLGHESPATTHQYVEADLTMKERALAKLREPEAKKLQRYKAPDSLINFLRTL
jgi:site-specific recombinase XerD